MYNNECTQELTKTQYSLAFSQFTTADKHHTKRKNSVLTRGLNCYMESQALNHPATGKLLIGVDQCYMHYSGFLIVKYKIGHISTTKVNIKIIIHIVFYLRYDLEMLPTALNIILHYLIFVYIPSTSLATTKLTNQDQDIYQMLHGRHMHYGL